MSWIAVITNSGNNLMSRWVAGTALEITAMKTGQGTVAQSQMMAQTALVLEKQTMSIVSGTAITGGRKIKAQVQAPATAYTLNQIGVFGKIAGDTSSVLIALYQNEDGVSIPSLSTAPDFLYTFFATIATSNTGTLNLTIDTSAVVSESTMEDYVEDKMVTSVSSSSDDDHVPTAKAVYDDVYSTLNEAKEDKGYLTLGGTHYPIRVSTTDAGQQGYITFVIQG